MESMELNIRMGHWPHPNQDVYSFTSFLDTLKSVKFPMLTLGLAMTNSTIQGFKDNDRTTLQTVYKKVYPKVKVYLLKNNGTEAHAKDVFQEAFVACWQNIRKGRLDENANIEAYLFTIAKNKWKDQLRSLAQRSKVLTNEFGDIKGPENKDPEFEKEWEANRKSLMKVLGRMGEQCKRILRLFYFKRKSMKEIASEMGLTPSSARNQKYRCMEKLRRLSFENKRHGG